MELSKEDKYLENKHKGGCSNRQGNSFEGFYATYSIATLIKEFQDCLEQVSISAQVPMSFIDDLLIVKPDNTRMYHQIKCVKKLNWQTGSSKGHSLKSDFSKQVSLCTQNKEIFHLYLVYAYSSNNVHKPPRSIKRYTRSVLFHSAKDINSLLQTNLKFRNVIKDICSIENPTDDILYGLAQGILGVWSSSSQSNIKVSSLVDEVISLSKSCISIKGKTINNSLSEECKSILDSVSASWNFSSGFLVFKLPKGELKFLWNNDFQQKIITQKPKTLVDFFKIGF